MTTAEVYFKTGMGLEQFAAWFRELMNLRDVNRSPFQLEQQRYGVNYGGDYFLFEVLGVELRLLRNQGEVEIPEHGDYYLYVMVRINTASLSSSIAENIGNLVNAEGIEAIVDSVA
ncbi:hypothetical protein [Kribbella sp. NPDC000426]|uniref:hypothetical protein n=1 Tax=Kribbella sp. NPDC000426 TaxID=3154255 RepID=UPI00331E6158